MLTITFNDSDTKSNYIALMRLFALLHKCDTKKWFNLLFNLELYVLRFLNSFELFLIKSMNSTFKLPLKR